ncbi:hypothetical protein M885DRAFT_312681 [Pelagophyceae sp. CCMP2097]|nr:hypothetical protein M885DRAFT_312681 [Pelagophyceae sp. CCMP2097]
MSSFPEAPVPRETLDTGDEHFHDSCFDIFKDCEVQEKLEKLVVSNASADELNQDDAVQKMFASTSLKYNDIPPDFETFQVQGAAVDLPVTDDTTTNLTNDGATSAETPSAESDAGTDLFAEGYPTSAMQIEESTALADAATDNELSAAAAGSSSSTAMEEDELPAYATATQENLESSDLDKADSGPTGNAEDQQRDAMQTDSAPARLLDTATPTAPASMAPGVVDQTTDTSPNGVGYAAQASPAAGAVNPEKLAMALSNDCKGNFSLGNAMGLVKKLLSMGRGETNPANLECVAASTVLMGKRGPSRR